MDTYRLRGILGVLAVTFAAGAQAPSASKARPVGIRVITPVFHQLVEYTLPPKFNIVSPEHNNGKFYLRETVLRGETVERWTEMITLSGAKGAAQAGMTGQRMILNLANGFKGACPETFAFVDVGATQFSGQPAYLGLVSCGKVEDEHGVKGAMHSETALLVALQGDEDIYTLQWAERASASTKPMPFDQPKWQARLKTLSPVRVCPVLEGEKAPYPSCLAK